MSVPAAPPKADVLGVGISATSYDGVSDLLAAWGDSATSGYVAVCNVHTIMEAHGNPDYARVLNDAIVATPDGMPLVWSLRRLGYSDQDRVYGPDLLVHFAAAAARRGGPASYFYGGRDGVAAEVKEKLQQQFPGFPVAGYESPPFRPLTEEEDDAAVERINSSGAGVVWVGLGAPKQEFWMWEHRHRIKPVMVGVGAAFDFLTGRVAQAPRLMMNMGLEWLWRLIMEPRRLWRRYLIHNPHFLYHSSRLLLLGSEHREQDAGR